MYYNKANYTKVTCKVDIKKKQAMWTRFKRRYACSKNPTEKKFLKTVAGQVCTDLKQWSKRWQKWGFGPCTWITKNYSATCFTSAKTSGGYKTGVRKNATHKTYGKRTTGVRSKGRTGSGTRSSVTRRSFSSW